MKPPCPEALYGQHGEPNTSGNCPYCGLHLGRPRLGRTSRSLTEEEIDGATSWSTRIPIFGHEDQDPLEFDTDPDDDPEPLRDGKEVWWSSQSPVWPE